MTKKTKKIISSIMLAASGLAMALASATDVSAQIFDNTYTGGDPSYAPNPLFKNSGTLRMLGSNKAAAVADSLNGEIIGIGTSVATRVEGTVQWAKAAEQNVQPLYYTNLRLGYVGIPAANTRTLGFVFPSAPATTSTFVSGVYDSFSDFAQVSYAPGTTFTYDGSNQRILGSTAANPYAKLAFTAGAKTVEVNPISGPPNIAGPVYVNEELTTAAVSAVNITDVALTIQGGTTSNIASSVTVDNAGTFAMTSPTGPVTAAIAAGGQVNLATATSALEMEDNTRLEVRGALSRTNAVDDNIRFDHSVSPATVAYYNGTNIMPVDDYPVTGYANNGSAYGRLEINEGVIASTNASGDIYVAGNVNDALLLVGTSSLNTRKSGAAGAITAVADYNRIIFTRNVNTGMGATGSGDGEVTGVVARNTTGAGQTYKFNNATTGFNATAATGSNRGDADIVGYFVVPGEKVYSKTVGKHNWDALNSPDGGVADRYVEVVKSNPATTIEVSAMTIGFKENFSNFAGSVHAPVANKTRTFEGLEASVDALPVKKVTPDSPTGLTAYDFGTVTNIKSGIRNVGVEGNTFAYAGNTMLLTNNVSAIFNTVRNGRWADPQTWAVGIQPGPEDVARLYHKVWTGDGAGVINGTNSGSTRPYNGAENNAAAGTDVLSATGAYNLAFETYIMPGGTYNGIAVPGGALFMGNTVAGAANSPLASSTVNDGTYSFGTLYNQNVAASTFNVDGILSPSGTEGNGLHGLFTTSWSNDTQLTNRNVARVLNLLNKGSVDNRGVVEVGE